MVGNCSRCSGIKKEKKGRLMGVRAFSVARATVVKIARLVSSDTLWPLEV